MYTFVTYWQSFVEKVMGKKVERGDREYETEESPHYGHYSIVPRARAGKCNGMNLATHSIKNQFMSRLEGMYESQNSFSSLKDRGEAMCWTVNDADTERVLQIGALKVNLDLMAQEQLSGKDKSRCKTLMATLTPGKPIPRDATRTHGIKDADVADRPTFKDIAEELREWIGDRPIIGHNVQFDKKFLSAEFERIGIRPLNRNREFCTMRYQEWNGGIRKGSRPDDVARVFGLTGRKARLHGAMEDAEIALQIALLFYLNDRGLARCLPARKPGFPSRSSLHEDESDENGGIDWRIIGGGVIIGYVVFAVTCS